MLKETKTNKIKSMRWVAMSKYEANAHLVFRDDDYKEKSYLKPAKVPLITSSGWLELKMVWHGLTYL